MLPAHIAQNIRKQILYYLQSTFTFRDKATDQAFQRFIEDPDASLFKGPWVQLKRPFRPAPAGIDPPFDINTTGAGSGKTECFLIPVLDHCRRAQKQGQKGVKAIVFYPMNALAAGIRVGNYAGRYDPADSQASMRGTVVDKAANLLIIIKKMIALIKLNSHAS